MGALRKRGREEERAGRTGVRRNHVERLVEGGRGQKVEEEAGWTGGTG